MSSEEIEQLEREYFEPDSPEMQAEIAASMSDERALALRRLVDMHTRIYTPDDLEAALGGKLRSAAA